MNYLLLLINRRLRRRLARAIKNCFKGVNWNLQVFIVGDVTMKTLSGEKEFYERKEIDKGIRRLNRLINFLHR